MSHHHHHVLDPARIAPRRASYGLGAVLLTAFLGLAATPPAAAHDDLVVSEPAESGLVEVMPSRAVLTFSGEILEVHDISLTGPDGSVVNGEPTVAGAEVRQNLWAGPAGEYVMTYDVISADGHEVGGEVHFEVGAVAMLADGETPDPAIAVGTRPDEDLGEQAVDVVLPLAVVGVAGVAALVLVRRRRGESS